MSEPCEKVQRYLYTGESVEPHEEGEYVLYYDYDRLLAANREKDAEIAEAKAAHGKTLLLLNTAAFETIPNLEAELASLRASVGGEKWIDLKQGLPPIAEDSDVSVILMGWYGDSWDLVRLHRTKGWITLPRRDKAKNPVISWHKLPQTPPSLPTEKEK